jgi:predicted outer membrane protein
MKRLAGLAIAAALLAGCATRPAPAPQRPPSRPPLAQPVPGSVSPATYVAQAASIDLFVIRSSELALVRSPSASVRSFATRMIEAHQGTSAQLAFAGRRLDLLPPAAMLPQQQAMYDELEASAGFDRTYLRLQRAAHGAALSLHSNFARRGESPTLRPVAANAEAIERSHLDMLRRL